MGFLFADNYLLRMGFYSFALSVPLFFFALGYFIKYREDMRVNRIAILYLFCMLIFFCHILSYALLILSLTRQASVSPDFIAPILVGFNRVKV